MRDLSGRPVAEGRANPEVRSMAPLEYKTCPYSGSRSNGQNKMNVSALMSVIKNWDEVLLIVEETKKKYNHAHSQENMNIKDLLRITEITSALPLYQYHELRNQEDPRVLDSVAATYKVMLGPKDVLNGFVFSEAHKTVKVLDRSLDAESFFSYVEENQSLIGGTEVCAGPNNMISELLNSLCDSQLRVPKNKSFYKTNHINFLRLTQMASKSYNLKVCVLLIGGLVIEILNNLR